MKKNIADSVDDFRDDHTLNIFRIRFLYLALIVRLDLTIFLTRGLVGAIGIGVGTIIWRAVLIASVLGLIGGAW